MGTEVRFKVSQIGPKLTAKAIRKATPLEVKKRTDELGLGHHEVRATLKNRDGYIAVAAEASPYSTGTRGAVSVSVAAVLCKEKACSTELGEASQRLIDSPDGHDTPNNTFPKGFYYGDFNSDGRQDLLVVMENGRGLVFEQQKLSLSPKRK